MSLRPLVAFALAGCAGVDTYTLAPWIEHVPAPVCATDPAVGSACGPGVAATAAGADYATLADALAGAPAGATVSVCPGEHPGPFEVVGRELVAYAPAAGATILSGGGAPGPVLTLEDATAWGLTVEGGGGAAAVRGVRARRRLRPGDRPGRGDLRHDPRQPGRSGGRGRAAAAARHGGGGQHPPPGRRPGCSRRAGSTCSTARSGSTGATPSRATAC
jgi:hypothetical protein